MKEKALASVGLAAIVAAAPVWYAVGPVAGDITMLAGGVLIFTAAWMLVYKEHKEKQEEINKLKK